MLFGGSSDTHIVSNDGLGSFGLKVKAVKNSQNGLSQHRGTQKG